MGQVAASAIVYNELAATVSRAEQQLGPAAIRISSYESRGLRRLSAHTRALYIRVWGTHSYCLSGDSSGAPTATFC